MDRSDPLMLKVCRACLSTDVKLFNLHLLGLADTFGHLTRNPVDLSDGLPQYVCYYCRALLQKCTQFQEKCREAHYYFQDICRHQLVITTEHVRTLAKKKFAIPLSELENQNVNYIPSDDIDCHDGEFNDERENSHNEVMITIDNIAHKNDSSYLYNDISDNFEDHDNLRSSDEDDDKEKLKDTVSYDVSFDQEGKIEIDDDNDIKEGIIEVEVSVLKKEESTEPEKEKQEAKVKIKKVTKKKKVKVTKQKSEKQTPKKKSNKYNEKSEEDFEEFSKLYNVDVVCLSLEQQIQRVKEKKESKEYKEARMSCDVCYKGFMTETAYKRHMKSHDPSTGAYPCDVCQLRYPSQRILRAHMRLHKREFVCRTCGHVNNSTTRAKQHSKWHKGFKYECKICHKQCNTQTTYMAHKREAHKPVTCEQCGEQLVGTLELSKHKTQAHAQSCLSCGTVFQTSEALERHKNDVNGCNSITISCWICGANFPFKSSLHQHIEERHGDKGGVFTCELCGAVFSSDRSLGIHYAYNHSKRVKHHSKKGLKLTNSKPSKDGAQSVYLCEICAKSFPVSPLIIIIHYAYNHSKRVKHHSKKGLKLTNSKPSKDGAQSVYLCEICAKSFPVSPLIIIIHYAYNHSKRVKHHSKKGLKLTNSKPSKDGAQSVYLCEICAKSFPVSPLIIIINYAYNHSKRVKHHSKKGLKLTNSKPSKDGAQSVYLCEICAKSFPVSPLIIIIHYAYNHSKRVKHHSKKGLKLTNSKPSKDGAQSVYLCEICAKSFPCPAKLKVHLQIHTGEKPYRCPMCPKSFRTKSALEIHINVHTGDRPYKCRQCPETFKSYAQRYKHNLMVHTRERRHKCSMCDKTYVIAYDLKAHVRFAHLHQPRPPRNRRRNHCADNVS